MSAATLIVAPESLEILEQQSKLLTEIHRLREDFHRADERLKKCVEECDTAQAERNRLREQYQAKRAELTHSLDIDCWRPRAALP